MRALAFLLPLLFVSCAHQDTQTEAFLRAAGLEPRSCGKPLEHSACAVFTGTLEQLEMVLEARPDFVPLEGWENPTTYPMRAFTLGAGGPNMAVIFVPPGLPKGGYVTVSNTDEIGLTHQ